MDVQSTQSLSQRYWPLFISIPGYLGYASQEVGNSHSTKWNDPVKNCEEWDIPYLSATYWDFPWNKPSILGYPSRTRKSGSVLAALRQRQVRWCCVHTTSGLRFIVCVYVDPNTSKKMKNLTPMRRVLIFKVDFNFLLRVSSFLLKSTYCWSLTEVGKSL